jgi:predicted permease
LFRSLQGSETFHTGFDNEHLAVAEFDLRRNGYGAEARRTFYDELAQNLKAIPNVVAVTRASVVPLGQDRESTGYRIEGYMPPNGNGVVSIANDLVGPDYFQTLGIPIIEGRVPAPGLAPGPPSEVVVNQAMAERFWPNQSAIGKRLGVDDNLTARIVGVARTIPYYQIGESPRPYVYVPVPTIPSVLTVFVKAKGDPREVLANIRQVVHSVDPKISAERIRTFAEVRRVPLFPARALLAVASGFGLLSLVLTLIGMYGVISYSVSRRTREFGIRMALGAKRSLVFRMVIREGLNLTLVGIVAGVAAALFCTRFLATLLFGITPTDPATFSVISILMILTASVACYIPARRATRVDPLVALREDG